jgi:glutathione synthase/RimK-type ligase-like ATP-grasp enzyme
MKAFILRRRKLGMTSCRSIAALSTKGIVSRRDPKGLKRQAGDISTIFRWGCTSDFPEGVEREGLTVINRSKAIHQVNDKVSFRQKLQEHSDETGNLLAPKTYFRADDIDVDSYPLVVRPKTHSRGKHLYVANNVAELREAIRRCGNGWYAGELINKTREYRIFVAQGRVACVAEKTPGNPKDVAWNVAKGGRFDNVSWDEWPLKAIRVSLEAFSLCDLDFGGVDVMIDEDNNAYVLEINSAPSLTSPYRQECFAKVFDHILEHGKKAMPLTKEKGGYRKFIHPAISDNARIGA